MLDAESVVEGESLLLDGESLLDEETVSPVDEEGASLVDEEGASPLVDCSAVVDAA